MTTIEHKLSVIVSALQNGSYSLSQDLQQVLELALGIFEANHAMIIVFNPITGNQIDYRATMYLDSAMISAHVRDRVYDKLIRVDDTHSDDQYGKLTSLGTSAAILPIGVTRYRYPLALLYLGFDTHPSFMWDVALVAGIFEIHTRTLLKDSWMRYRQDTLLKFSQNLYRNAPTPEALFQQINDEIHKVLDTSYGWSMSLADVDGAFKIYTIRNGEIKTEKNSSVHDLILYVQQSKRSLFVHNLSMEYDDLLKAGIISPETVRDANERSWLLSPLLIKDECVGVLAVWHTQDGYFDLEDLGLLALIGNQAEAVLSDYRQAKDMRDMLDRLHFIDSSIGNGAPLAEILKGVLSAVKNMMPQVDEGAVLMLKPGTDILENKEAFGEYANERKEKEYKRGDSSHARDVFDNIPTVSSFLNNVREARAAGIHYTTVSPKTEHELDVKIGEFGVLNLETNLATRPFSEIDLKNAGLLAGQALIAIQKWEILNQRKSLSEMQKQIAIMPNEQITAEEMYTKLLNKACELNGALHGSLFILDESEHGDNGNFVQMVRFGEIPPNMERLRTDTIRLVEKQPGIVGTFVNQWLHLLKDGSKDFPPQNIGDIKEAPWNEMYRGYFPDTRSELVVPLITENEGEKPRLLGAMNFESPIPNFFTTSDANITQEFAQMCVIVLNQTRGNYFKKISEALHRIDNTIIESLKQDDERRQQVDQGLITSEDADQQAEKENGRAIVVALNEAKQMFAASRAILYVFDTKRRRVRAYESSESENFLLPDEFFPLPSDLDETFPIPLGNALVDHLILNKKIRFRLFDRVLDVNEKILGSTPPAGIESAMAVKITEGDVTLGILYIESEHKNQFLSDDLENLEKFARQIQLAYQLTFRVESLQRSRKRLLVLRKVASDLTLVQTQKEAYRLVLDAACEMIKNKTRVSRRFAAAIRLYDPNEAKLKVLPELVFEDNLNLHAMPIEIGKGVTGYVVEQERDRLRKASSSSKQQLNLVTVGNYSTDSKRYWDDIKSKGNHVLPPEEKTVIRSILAVPIITEKKSGVTHLYGALTLTSNQYYYFSRGDEDFMRTLVVLLLDSLRRIEQAEEKGTIQLGMLAFELTHPILKPATTMRPSIAFLEKRLQALGIQLDNGIKVELDTLKEQIEVWISVTTQMKEAVALRDIRGDDFKAFDAITLFKEVRNKVEDVRSNLKADSWVRLIFGEVKSDIKNFKVEISESLFLSAISNLVRNCIEALSDHHDGTISITLTDNGHGDYLFLHIIDNGHGIVSDILPKIFELGVTTKEDRGGSGLGMWLVKKYLGWQSIDIIAENQEVPNKGAKFTLVIPALRQI
jgi:GAF domain-containing protein